MIKNITKAVLFDLDGTLFDTAPDFIHILNEMRTARDLPTIHAEEFRPIISRGSAEMVKYAFKLTEKSSEYAEILAYFYEQYHEKMGQHSHFFPGMLAVLDELDARQVKWGIVTNRLEKNIPNYLAHFNILDRVHCIVGADTTAHRKPHPSPLIHAAKLLGMPRKQCLYVGDYPTDIEAAKSANMIAVAATWGYCESVTRLEEKKPTHIIHQPADIITLLSTSFSV